ncbi:MAG: hypothetical protein QME78_05615, partial [Thermodesulfobacteriota bacterium]|nr:hypothetical protein [Thermodesulfobacteriota bacterium]
EGYQLRERFAGYEAFFGAQKDDIGLENTYRWDINTIYSGTYLGPTPFTFNPEKSFLSVSDQKDL